MLSTTKAGLSGTVFAAALGLIGCSQGTEQKVESVLEKNMVTRAVAILNPVDDSGVRGTVYFTQTDGGIKIVADVSGLTPGKHGFHVHEYGDCTALDGNSAGGHFNPDNKPHGAPSDTARHVGDLGNLEADAQGNAHYERVDTLIAFSGPHDIIGRGIIVHGSEDDFKTQPTGAAGARVACGVIGVENPNVQR